MRQDRYRTRLAEDTVRMLSGRSLPLLRCLTSFSTSGPSGVARYGTLKGKGDSGPSFLREAGLVAGDRLASCRSRKLTPLLTEVSSQRAQTQMTEDDKCY